MAAGQHRHQVARSDQARGLEKGIFGAGRRGAEHRAQALTILLQRHDGHHIGGVFVHDRRRGQPRRAGHAAAAAGQCGRKAHLRYAQGFHQAGGVELVGIAGAGTGVVGEAVDLLHIDPGVITGGEYGGPCQFVDGLRIALPAHIIGRGSYADDGRLVLIDPGHARPFRFPSAFWTSYITRFIMLSAIAMSSPDDAEL